MAKTTKKKKKKNKEKQNYQGYNPQPLAHNFIQQWGFTKKVIVDGEPHVRNLLQWHCGNFYFWKCGRYELLTKDEMMAKITRFVQGTQTKPTPACVNAVLLNVKALTAFDSKIPLNSWINGVEGPRVLVVKNGMVALKDLDENGRPELLSFNPDYFTLIQLPYSYDAKAKCPKWLKFLDEVMEGDKDRIHLLQQWTGYLLTLTLKEQKFLICVGEGANGKGVFFEVLIELLGQENCSSLPLSRFGQRFSLASTYGKLLNATSEGMGRITAQEEAVLKEYTAGDNMTFEYKHKSAFSAKPTAKLMIATNELPAFSDKTDGVWRRILLMPFERNFTEDQQNKNLAEELKEELPGIFNWAFDGMLDLEENGFVEPDKCKAAIEQYRKEVNPAKVFLQENYRVNPEAEGMSCGSVYSLYSKWCKVKGGKPLGDANFGKEIRRVFPGVKKGRPRINGKKTTVYTNLAYKEDAEIRGTDFWFEYAPL